ncbi:hypothetical protein [Mucilaginibacter sp.]|uniref:hypothetical protein n=1 Tax=Mucilaginibacter sp. TaxID=1882438 RepID=UPI002ED57690
MKSLFVLLLASILTASVKAQELSFEQVTNYIKQNVTGRVMYPGDLDAYSRVKGYILKTINIQKNGTVELQTDQANDANHFKISFNIFDLVDKVDYPNGIRAYRYLVHFNGLNVSNGYGITFATDADAEKVARAFRYLKKVCVKEDDLFSKPTAEEAKPTLSRDETIIYINNLLHSASIHWLENIDYRNRPDIEKRGVDNYVSFKDRGLSYYEGNQTYTLSYHFWTGQVDGLYTFNEFYDKSIKFGADFSLNLLENTEITRSGNSRRLSVHSGKETLYVYVGDMTPKEIEKLKKAFTRLYELDKPGKDPFE